MADISIRIGPPRSSDSYLNINAIIKACKESGATSVLPGYGFLSENSEFAMTCLENDIIFIGPSIKNLCLFSLKHKALELAAKLDIPLLPASPLLSNYEEAMYHANIIGYPVLIKSTAGGGGIGIKRCCNEQELENSFKEVVHLAFSNFGNGEVFIEKYLAHSRHIEVQIFGDGNGKVICLGERECSIQRRFQKIIEETPSPFVTQSLRKDMCKCAQHLCESIKYQSAGTVEFLVDSKTQKYYLLEVNTRLQVEHAITEMVSRIDIVEWMILLAGKDDMFTLYLEKYVYTPFGHSIECRINAEDPANNFRPCIGKVTHFNLPKFSYVRYDHWISNGIEVTHFYDSLLIKVIVHGETRANAIERTTKVLSTIILSGLQTNKEYLLALLCSKRFQSGDTTTTFCNTFEYDAPYLEVIQPGLFSSLQNWPGRTGFWNIGVPPSGPMDELSLRIANRIVGNDDTACGIEMTMHGMTIRCHHHCIIALTGAHCRCFRNDQPIKQYAAIMCSKGDIVRIEKCVSDGIRIYLAVAGGFNFPEYLGSQSTFPLGQFGGLQGKILEVGDMLPLSMHVANIPKLRLSTRICKMSSTWSFGVIYGPHGAPDFITQEYMNEFWQTTWKAQHNSSRLGIRLNGPKPTWARHTGGDAGLHPSNIHDCAYAIGSVNFTGDYPVILGVGGPSLGGFVCPVTIAQAELWKMGQVKPGDSLQFDRISHNKASKMRIWQTDLIKRIGVASIDTNEMENFMESQLCVEDDTFVHDAVLDTIPTRDDIPSITIRAQGDANVLIEYGEMVLDIDLRICVWMFMKWIETYKRLNPDSGLGESSPGVRSVQVQYDSRVIDVSCVLEIIRQCKYESFDSLEIPCRKIMLPLSFDDKWSKDAISRYAITVNSSKPYLPSNVDFVARMNGLESKQEVLKMMLNATYLVLGLGDVYLNAPCAVPINPQHRLVTSKYTPSRTFKPEGAVGIGGSYMCIYGMESPGGYQLVGRTLPIWNTYATKPQLFHFFDKIQFYKVSDEELASLRNDYKSGKFSIAIRDDTFKIFDYYKMLKEQKSEIKVFKEKQKRAFIDELQCWINAGMIGRTSDDDILETEPMNNGDDYPSNTINSPVAGSIWKIFVKEDEMIHKGQIVAILESMKMEFSIQSQIEGQVYKIAKHVGQFVTPEMAILYVMRHA